jgi:hypothetical protein
MRRTGIQNTSSLGPPKRSGRPPNGPAPGPVSPGRPPKDLQDLGKGMEIHHEEMRHVSTRKIWCAEEINNHQTCLQENQLRLHAF